MHFTTVHYRNPRLGLSQGTRTAYNTSALPDFYLYQLVQLTIPMCKRSSARLFLVGVSLAATLTTRSFAQDSDERYELSPLSVTGEGGDYKADTTLAATLTPSDLDDFGASIAVITEQFMEDLGSTDGESLLSMVGNMEVGGVQGNISQVNINNWSTNDARNNPQEMQRVRGLGRALLTRNFFRSNLPFDSYNTSRVTINRGQNSILYGFGSAGGVIDSATSRARLDSDFGEIALRVGHRGGHRETLDINKTLVKNRLGIRIAALNEDVQFEQDPAFERDQRISLALEAILSKNDKSPLFGRTIIQANYETGNILRNPPDVVPPVDGFSSWFEGIGGSEILNGILSVPGISLEQIPSSGLKSEWVLDAINSRLVEVPEGQSPEEYARIEGTFVPKIEYDRIRDSGFDSFLGFTPNTLNPTINFNSPQAGSTAGWSDPALDGIQGIMARWQPDGFNPQDVRWTRSLKIGPGFSRNSLQNRDVFDYHNTLWQGNTNHVETDFDARQLFLEQDFFEGKAGLVVGYDKQTREQSRLNAFSSSQSKTILIDASAYHAPADSDFDGVPDRTPNENVGRPVAIAKDTGTTDEQTVWQTFQTTAFAEWDFSDRLGGVWGEIFGAHTASGLYAEYNENLQWTDRQGAWWADSGDNPAESFISNGFNEAETRRVYSQVYLGPDVRGLNSSDAVRIDGPLDIRLPRTGDQYGIWYFDDRSIVDEGTVNEWRVIEHLEWGNRFRRTLDSKAASLQSHFLWGTLVTTVGIREDHQNTQGRRTADEWFGPTGTLSIYTDDPGINATDGNFNTLLLETLDPESVSDTEGETSTWSIVGHYPEVILGELPMGMDLSFHYYEADSFEPDFDTVNILNEPIPEPRAESREWGFTLNFLEDKLSLRVNRFKTVNVNATTTLNGAVPQIRTEIDSYTFNIAQSESFEGQLFPDPLDQLLTPDTRPSNRQRRTGTDADLIGVNSFAEYYELLFNIMPPRMREVWDYKPEIQEQGEVFITRFDPNGPLRDTEDTVARGTEIELSGKIGKNWVLSLNVAQQETVRSNIAPFAVPLALEMLQRIKDLELYDIRENPYLREQKTIGDWFEDLIRTIRIEKAQEGIASQEQREWRVNLLSRYDFKDGPLKGLSIGGALRYQDEIVAGYPNKWDAFGNAIPDVDNPYFGPDELNGDLFFRYTRPISNKILWSLQFNARNLYRKNGDDDIPVTINPDGRLSLIRIPNQQEFFVTNTFRF